MKRFKKWMALILAMACVLSLAACGTQKNETETKPAETLSDKQDEVSQIMESLATQNAAAEVGEYVLVEEADLSWEEVDGGVAITSYTGTATAIELPAQVDGKDVVEIRGGAFQSNLVVGVKLPDTVVTIGDHAFDYVTTLVEVQLGAGVTTIGAYAFEGCLALTDIEFNESLTTIGDMAFSANSSLKNVNLPEGLSQIGEGAFVMSGIEKIVIPGSVNTIGEQAFSTCASLTEVVIQSGVKVIDSRAFEGCKQLERVEIPDTVESIEFAAFKNSDSVTIYAPAGSAAESYAKENEIAFQSK